MCCPHGVDRRFPLLRFLPYRFHFSSSVVGFFQFLSFVLFFHSFSLVSRSLNASSSPRKKRENELEYREKGNGRAPNWNSEPRSCSRRLCRTKERGSRNQILWREVFWANTLDGFCYVPECMWCLRARVHTKPASLTPAVSA